MAQPPVGHEAEASAGPHHWDSRWRWPLSGPPVSEYGVAGGVGDGIGIGGELGADVRAFATGEAVYAGRGLAVDGLLVILRHDEVFLKVVDAGPLHTGASDDCGGNVTAHTTG